MQNFIHLDIQGHRGARGLYPENTVNGFIEALRVGVTSFELDVVISGDKKVVVSHEPWMNPLFCFNSDGSPIDGNSEEKYNLYKMSYEEIKKFDCGTFGNPVFPLQRHASEHKPLLSEVFSAVESYRKKNGIKPVTYNIEIKSEEKTDGVFHPFPDEFTDLVYKDIKGRIDMQQIIIQSFDTRIVSELKKKKDDFRIGLLSEYDVAFESKFDGLGFAPHYFNPEYRLVDEALVNNLHSLGVKILPWTVNEVADMEKLIALGVDGLITDYPDKAIDLLKDY